MFTLTKKARREQGLPPKSRALAKAKAEDRRRAIKAAIRDAKNPKPVTVEQLEWKKDTIVFDTEKWRID